MRIADVVAMIRPIATRIANLVGMGVLRSTDDAKEIQLSRVDLLDDESREVERLQNYGFTSVPMDGAEGLVIFLDGRRDNGLAIVVDDRRYRLQSLQNGEVAVFDHQGSKILLRADGSIALTPASGEVEITGDLTVSGTVTATTDVVGGGKSLKTHTHSVAGTVAAAPGPVVFVPPNLTGAPS